jgi:ketosteroid isomerase-like protein
VDVLDRLWAPQITVVVPGMQPFAKTDLLRLWRTMKVSFSAYATSDLNTQVFGDTAVATGRLHRVRDFGGKTSIDDWLFTKTYARIAGEWKVVAYHASIAPPANP